MDTFNSRPRTIAAFLLGLVLASCGGGGGSGSGLATGSSSQSSSGTVSGFGSVFVDGVELQDVKAATRIENADGTYSSVALQLGQRVRIAHDGGGNASTVTVDAAVIGAVVAGSIDSTTLTLTVAGQKVQANNDIAVGPITRFGGTYNSFADIVAGDLVEVHGSAVYDSSAKVYVVKATRIEKKSAINAVRVMGKIANLDTSAKTFQLGALTVGYGSASLAPYGTTLADGQSVVVWGAQSALSSSASTLTLNASRVRVANASLADNLASGTTQLGGVVSNYNASAGSFELEGVKIVVGSASITPTGASLANGAWVQVSGTVGSDGSINATSLRVRQANTLGDLATVRLSGAIETLTDQHSFVLRGVPVDAASAAVDASCSGVTLAVGSVVNVVATVQSGTDVVLASNVSCPNPGAYTMRALSGTASNVDSTSKSFTLTTTANVAQKVQWNDQTYFAGVTATTLSGVSLVVDGYLDASSTLIARTIRNPNVASGQHDADDYGKPNNNGERSWTHYRSQRH